MSTLTWLTEHPLDGWTRVVRGNHQNQVSVAGIGDVHIGVHRKPKPDSNWSWFITLNKKGLVSGDVRQTINEYLYGDAEYSETDKHGWHYDKHNGVYVRRHVILPLLGWVSKDGEQGGIDPETESLSKREAMVKAVLWLLNLTSQVYLYREQVKSKAAQAAGVDYSDIPEDVNDAYAFRIDDLNCELHPVSQILENMPPECSEDKVFGSLTALGYLRAGDILVYCQHDKTYALEMITKLGKRVSVKKLKESIPADCEYKKVALAMEFYGYGLVKQTWVSGVESNSAADDYLEEVMSNPTVESADDYREEVMSDLMADM